MPNKVAIRLEAMAIDGLSATESVRNLAQLERGISVSEGRSVFDLSRNFTTDRSHFEEDIRRASLKRNIIQHGPCRPEPPGSFEIFDKRRNVSSNFLVQGITTST